LKEIAAKVACWHCQGNPKWQISAIWRDVPVPRRDSASATSILVDDGKNDLACGGITIVNRRSNSVIALTLLSIACSCDIPNRVPDIDYPESDSADADAWQDLIRTSRLSDLKESLPSDPTVTHDDN